MNYKTSQKAVVILADGTIFHGKSIGATGSFGEVCFNTGTTGYQEIFTDPSYFGQLMVTTNAHIGNYGVTHSDDMESSSIKISGLICRNFSFEYSRPSANDSLDLFLLNTIFLAVSDVDTRALIKLH